MKARPPARSCARSPTSISKRRLGSGTQLSTIEHTTTSYGVHVPVATSAGPPCGSEKKSERSMLGWLECRSMARTRRSGVNRSCVLIAPISSTGAPGELGTRPRARSRRSTQRLVEWSDVFSAEASCCAAVPVGGCERGRGERAHAAHLVHAHAANLLKLLCDRRCLGRGASRLKAVEDAVVLARHSSCVPARSHPRGRRHDDHGFQNQNEGEGENGTNPCDEVSEAAAANVLLPMFGIPKLIMCCTWNS